MNYSKALKIIRATNNLTQQELANRLCVSKSLISRVESKERALSPQLQSKLQKEFRIPKDLMLLLASDKESGLSSQDRSDFGALLLKTLFSTNS